MQKSNATALAMMQKRYSTAVSEMAKQFPGKGTEQLEKASHAYERAANAISEAMLEANKEAMEALQAWSSDRGGAGEGTEQKAA